VGEGTRSRGWGLEERDKRRLLALLKLTGEGNGRFCRQVLALARDQCIFGNNRRDGDGHPEYGEVTSRVRQIKRGNKYILLEGPTRKTSRR
jgi:hypothetical protein